MTRSTSTGKSAKDKATQVGRAYKRNRLGAAYSKSMGKVKTSRRALKNPFNQFLSKGVVFNQEVGAVVNNVNNAQLGPTTFDVNQVVYVGHATNPITPTGRVICHAIVKRLLAKAQIPYAHPQQQIDQAAANRTYEMEFGYQLNPSGNILVQPVYEFTGSFKADDLAARVSDWLFTGSQLSTGQYYPRYINLNQITFRSTSANPTEAERNRVRLSTINLYNAKISLLSKSHMKLQNRTTTQEGGEADEVDNVPIYGKSYEGPGNGAIYGSYALRNIGLGSGANTGQAVPQPLSTAGSPLINPKFIGVDIQAGRPAQFQEPPHARMFRTVTKAGKIHLDPGQIKTSVLFIKKTYSLMKLWRMLILGPSTPVDPNYKTYLGKYRFFCVEKMIQSVGTTVQNQINVAYEIDYKIGAICHDKFSNYTAPIVSVSPL